MSHPKQVLDASALLAYVQDEPGAEMVAQALKAQSWMSMINWAEVLSKLAELGQPPEVTISALKSRGILGQTLVLHRFDDPLAQDVARLRPLTKALGLSLGDRACLALARRLALPALTTDRAWGNLQVGVEVRVIR